MVSTIVHHLFFAIVHKIHYFTQTVQIQTQHTHAHVRTDNKSIFFLTLKVLVATIDAQWEGMGDAGSARYEPALLPPCPTIRVLSYSN